MNTNEQPRPVLALVPRADSIAQDGSNGDTELRCLRDGCDNVLAPDQAYFCSQQCLDLYEEPDVDSFTEEAWATYWADYRARMLKADKISTAPATK